MTPGLWFDFIAGCCIILIPLAIVIITIDRGLNSKYEALSQRIARLNRKCSSKMDDNVGTPALKKSISMREAEQMLLAEKIRFFRIYSITAYLLIIISMGILPVLVYAGFNWRWK